MNHPFQHPNCVSAARRLPRTLLAVLFILGAVWSALAASAQVNVTAQHNNVARTGLNAGETTLTLANVNATSFGQLFTLPVDGYVFAQPLYLSNVSIGIGTHNVVFIATEHDSVYAFDADNGTQFWQRSFINPLAGITTVSSGDVGTGDIVPEIGITGTPVIDSTKGILYVVAKTKEVVNNQNTFVQRLHALDVHTGNDLPGSPLVIQAKAWGNGEGSVGGILTFNPLIQNQRSALLRHNGNIYVAFASHGDNGPYHGWIIGYSYNGSAFTKIGVFCTNPNARTDPSGYPIAAAGIWQAGNGPAADASNIYFETGNGSFNPTDNVGTKARNGSYGDSFVKVNDVQVIAGNNLNVAGYFTPFNQDALNRSDEDLGSGGLTILPDSVGSAAHKHLLVGSGKEGKIYLIDRDNMGKFTAGVDKIVQSLPNAIGGAWSSPAYFNGTVYYHGTGDVLKAFSISNAHMTLIGNSNVGFGYPGPTPSVSANGTTNGIVWEIEYGGDGNAALHAFNAANVGLELYNSNNGRDNLGGAVKFAVPTIANGKVFVGTQYGVGVFGLGQWTPTPTITPNGGEFTSPVQVSMSDANANAAIYYTLDGSDPTQNSTHYTGKFTLSSPAAVRARAFAPGLNRSGLAASDIFVGQAPGNGDGLFATYFSHIDLTGSTAIRVDPTVNFNWNGGSPANGIPGNNWSARWTGFVQPRSSGSYTFSTITDDGVRLWVNNQLIIDNWTYHAPTQDNGTITLTAGTKYAIKMEFFQGEGGSVAQLFYSALGLSFQIIPQSQLYSH